ncbi:MAG: YceI family protein [Acidobacteriota bacterium]
MHWEFEPGHTAAGFRCRHMMVTWVGGHFKNIQGSLEFDPERPAESSFQATIDANALWTGDSARDEHLRSPDFLDTAKHPHILFQSSGVEVLAPNEFRAHGNLILRGVTRSVPLEVRYCGQWQTPYWEDGADKGPVIRAGFSAAAVINRHHFEVNWNSTLDRGGLVVGDEVFIEIDVEALHWP